MDPSVNSWSMGAHSQQEPTVSLPLTQLFFQLNQLYDILRGFNPDWSQQNPFQSFVTGRSDTQLYELYATWNQWINDIQVELCAAVPMGDATEQQPGMSHIDQGFSHGPEAGQPLESTTINDGLNGGTQAVGLLGVENGEQAEAPRYLDARGTHQLMDYDPAPLTAPQAALPLTATRVEAIEGNGTTSLPGWLSPVQPQPEGHVIAVRRECKVTIEINLMDLPALPGHRLVTWKGLVVPSTAGVRTEEYGGERDVLHLSVRVFGADTKREYDAVCMACNKREGKKKGIPSLIDFHAVSDVIKAPEDGLVRVKFQFSCYPKHQNPNESAYLLQVVLSEKGPQAQASYSHGVVAMCRLPWHFKVGRRLHTGAAPVGGTVPPWNGADNPCEQQPVTGDTPALRPRAKVVRRVPRVNVPEQPPSVSSLSEGEPQVTPIPDPQTCITSNLVARPPAVQRKRRLDAADLYDGDAQPAPAGRQVRPRLDAMENGGAEGQSNNAPPNPLRPHSVAASIGHEANPTLIGPNPSEPSLAFPTARVPSTMHPYLSSSEPDSESTLDPSDNHASDSQQRVGPDTQGDNTTEAEPANTTLQATNPGHGPVTGGIPIWLSVLNPPTNFPLFARFGTNVTAAFFVNPSTLTCTLPSASAPGRVRVTLSREFGPNQPQFGASAAEFVYKAEFDQLIEILLLMKQAGSHDYTPEMQAVLNILNPPQNEQHQGRSHRTPHSETVESSVVQALLSLRTQPNFQHVISVSNDYSQTLTHLSVLYGFKTLLRHLLDWSAELGVADNNGLTALHCAYLAGDRDSILLLRRGGASMSIPDKLGRLPLDLWPGGPDSASEVEAAIVADLENGPPVPQDDVDEQAALGAQFDALDDACYGGNDSGDGGSNSDEDKPNDVQDDDDRYTMGIATSTCSLGPSTSKETTVETMNHLLQSRRKRKNRGPRIIPDTPHDAAVSGVVQKLRESEAEPAAIEFLCNGVFPSGTITLDGLRAPMSSQEITQFQVGEGTQKYRGLLSREREVFNCRLCPEDNKLDFKDPEEALHHITKSHFDMGYSCKCGCDQIYWRSTDLRKHQKETSITHKQAMST